MGCFRQDLYYRLAVVPVHLPPLRERPEDVLELCESLILRIAAEMKIHGKRLTPAALEKLCGYPFPGNIRELRNLLERALILGKSAELRTGRFLSASTSFCCSGSQRRGFHRNTCRSASNSN